MKRAGLFLMLILALTACAAPLADTSLPAIDPGIDPDTWALIPAGEFLMGQYEHETMLDYDFEMMVTHVTNAQFADYLNAALADGAVEIADGEVVGFYPGDEFHAHHHEEPIDAGNWLHLPINADGQRLRFENDTFTVLTGYENHPATMVTWFGARAYCESNEWRLPLEAEWEKAARGTDARAYPWGNDIARTHANYYSSHDLYEKIVGGLGDTTPVGFYNGGTYQGFATQDSVSPYGLYDMAGNVWQWAGNVHEGQHYRYMRGGSKENYAYNLRIWTRNNAHPAYFSVNVGFRCARDTE